MKYKPVQSERCWKVSCPCNRLQRDTAARLRAAGKITPIRFMFQRGDTKRFNNLQVICIKTILLQCTAVLGELGIASHDTTQPHSICEGKKALNQKLPYSNFPCYQVRWQPVPSQYVGGCYKMGQDSWNKALQTQKQGWFVSFLKYPPELAPWGISPQRGFPWHLG